MEKHLDMDDDGLMAQDNEQFPREWFQMEFMLLKSSGD